MPASLAQLLERIPLDNKLITSFVTVALTRAVLAIGLDVDDPLVGTAIALAVGAVVGYLTPNDATVLRNPQDSGNAVVPDEASDDDLAEGEIPEDARP